MNTLSQSVTSTVTPTTTATNETLLQNRGGLAERSRKQAVDFSSNVTGMIVSLLNRASVNLSERESVMLAPASLTPLNAATGFAFTGYNRLALVMHMMARNLSDPRFVTFRQAVGMSEAAGKDVCVRKGEKALALLKPTSVGKLAKKGGESDGADEQLDHEIDLDELVRYGVSQAEVDAMRRDSPDRTSRRVFFTPYHVFHASQVENIPPYKAVQVVRTTGMKDVDRLVSTSGAVVQHGADHARYSPAEDAIHMPPRQSFRSVEAYYTALLREFYHWTGGPKREERAVIMAADDAPSRDTVSWTDRGRALEEIRADVFAVKAMVLAGMQPDFEGTPPYVRELGIGETGGVAGDRDVEKAIVAAVTQTLPMVEDADRVIRSSSTPSAHWWPGGGQPAANPFSSLRLR